MDFSDYIIYVDESGDHNLKSIDPNYPIFALAFCIFEIKGYIENVVPKIQKLKFDWFGHDAIILHEREIKKGYPPFDRLGAKTGHEAFLKQLSDVLDSADFTVVSAVIHKEKHKNRYSDPADPYKLALMFCLERTCRYLNSKNQQEKTTQIVFEKRGRKEDLDLELEFRRICDGASYEGKIDCLEMLFADKKINSTGLQLADLVAKPLGMKVFKPEQSNRAFNIIENKLYCGANGNYHGLGLKTFP